MLNWKKNDSEFHWAPYLHFLNEEGNQVSRQIRPGYSPKRYLMRLCQSWDPNTICRLHQAGSLRDSVQLQQLPTITQEISRRYPDLSSVPSKYQCPPVFSSSNLPCWTHTDVLANSGMYSLAQEELEDVDAPDIKILQESSKSDSATQYFNGVAQRRPTPEPAELYENFQKRNERYINQKGQLQERLQVDNETTNERAELSDKPPIHMPIFMGKNIITSCHGKPHTTFYGGCFNGTKKYNIQDINKNQTDEPLSDGRFLPHIPQSHTSGLGIGRERKNKVHESLNLPPILEEAPQRMRRFNATDPPEELIIIPLMVHFQCQMPKREEKRYRKGGDVLTMPEAPPIGSLPPINGKKGPGNQSSMAGLKVTSSNSSSSGTAGPKPIPTGIIRGSIPEELKECCKSGSVGSLIMSPDGEIVCLSLVGAVQDTNIPIRFDFIPEEDEGENEEDCLPLESWGQEGQWVHNQPSSEQGMNGTNIPTLHIPTGLQEEEATPIYHKEKKKHQNVTLPSSNEYKSMSEDPVRDNTEAEQMPIETRDERIEVPVTADEVEDELQRITYSPKEQLTNMEEIATSAHVTPRSTSSLGRVSRRKVLDQTSKEIEFQMRTEPSERVALNEDNLKEFHAGNTVHQQPTDDAEQTLSQVSKKEKKIGREKLNKPEHSDKTTVPLRDTLSKEEIFPGQGPMKQQIKTEDSQDNVSSLPILDKGEHTNKKEEAKSAVPEKQKSSEKKISERKPRVKNTESEEKVPKAKRELPPITLPLENEIEDSLNKTITEDEEVAILEEIASGMKQETTKIKGKKKSKSDKVQKTEKTPITRSTKNSQQNGKQQGRAAFVVGQPKEKKLEGTISNASKATSLAEKQEIITETNNSVNEEEELTQKENDAQSETEESQNGTSTPKHPENLPFIPDVDSDYTDNQIPHQEAEESVSIDETPASPPEVVVSLPLPSEDAKSEISEATSGPVRHQRSSRARELSEKAERRRIEVEKKRREREEQLRLEQEQQERMEMMRKELEEEQLRRAEENRQKKQQHEEEKFRQEQERQRRLQLEQQTLERARQQQEEHRKKLQELHRRKQQEELERTELERQRQREQELQEAEERRRLLEMEDEEREEYKRNKKEKEEEAKRQEQERKQRAEEEARAILEEAQRQAQLLARQAAALEQQLQFNRGLLTESIGLDQTQSISRPWVFSYFEFLQLLGLPLPTGGDNDCIL
ncbi:uncharacterized protein KIAA2012 homolog [Bombina bombina]|uniref:uncharacterized protein KIAA2012 homolog n=1 Tax=Bombina bombina TaxID=8345 RepID=UPI00235B194C|nr:uncharacterized protein KIAA2012 homolog [Bombina bombina]